MRVAFAGTPEFAARALAAIIAAGHEIVLVLTQPDRPSGRGMRPHQSAVKRVALERGLALAEPANLRTAESRAPLERVYPDVVIVAAYGLILPQAVLDLPRHGCVNIHASLLPRWRGAAPIQRAIAAGDQQTGISIMQMDAGLDTGPILMQRAIGIEPRDTAGSLHDRLAKLGADLIVSAAGLLESGNLPAVPQPDHGATYASKLDKAETELDLSQPALLLERLIRAFDPVPGARLSFNDVPLRVWRAEVVAAVGEPGAIVASGPSGIIVACGEQGLRLLELQRPGGIRLAVREFLSGFPLPVGSRFRLCCK